MLIEPITFRPEEAAKVRSPSLREVIALNNGILPRMGGGAQQTWETLINAYQSGAASGAAYNNSKTIKDISPGAAVVGESCTVPAGYLLPGSIIRYTAKGWFSTKAATNPTFIMGLYWGAVAGKALAVTAALETIAGAAEQPWELQATTRIVTIGEAGKAITQGHVIGLTTPVQSVKLPAIVNILPATKPQTEIVINTATQNQLTLGGTWGTESAENTLTCTQWLVELLN